MINLDQCRAILDKMRPEYAIRRDLVTDINGIQRYTPVYKDEYKWLCKIVLQEDGEISADVSYSFFMPYKFGDGGQWRDFCNNECYEQYCANPQKLCKPPEKRETKPQKSRVKLKSRRRKRTRNEG